MAGKIFLAVVIAFAVVIGGAAMAGAGEARTVVQRGHNATVASLAFSPDERQLASLSEDGNLKLWQTAPPCLLDMTTISRMLPDFTQSGVKIPGQSSPHARLVFRPDGVLAVVSEDRQVLFSGNGLTSSETRMGRYGLSADGRVETLLPPLPDKTKGEGASHHVVVRETATGCERAVFDLDFFPQGCVISNNGSFLVVFGTKGDDQIIERLDLTKETSVLRRVVPGAAKLGGGFLYPLAVSPDGGLFAAAVIDAEQLASPPLKRSAFDNDLAVFSWQDFRELARAKLFREFTPGETAQFSPAGELLYCAAKTRDELKPYFVSLPDLKPVSPEALRDDASEMSALAFSPDGRFWAVGRGGDPGCAGHYLGFRVDLYDTQSHAVTPAASEDGYVVDLAAGWGSGLLALLRDTARNGRFPGIEAYASSLQEISVVSAKDGSLRWHSPAASRIGGKFLAISANGRVLGASGPAGMLFFEAATGRELGQAIPGIGEFTGQSALNSEGTLAAVGVNTGPLLETTYTLRLIGVPDGKTRAEIGLGEIRPLRFAFSPDGRLLAQQSQGEVILRHLPSGRVRARLAAPDGFASSYFFGFSPDGRRLLAGITRYETASGKNLGMLPDIGSLAGRGPSFQALNGLAVLLPDGRRGFGFDAAFDLPAIVDLRSKKTLALLYPFSDAVVWLTPDGYFSGFGDYRDKVRFVVAHRCIRDERLWRERSRPDVVARALDSPEDFRRK
ncbi:MAG: hypothetical protein HQK81_09210 [Desulfovibrionaceae bacterium]|nr:hypothetical protein [Desulfovibrionaceae bacterium]MBF0514221.1 hypothetical protein [Desulfovibrionaceae bacterium]